MHRIFFVHGSWLWGTPMSCTLSETSVREQIQGCEQETRKNGTYKYYANSHSCEPKCNDPKEDFEPKCVESKQGCEPECRLYKTRWLMLAIFICHTFLCSLQYSQYVIISNLITDYYAVSSFAVDWTVIVYSAVYLPFIFPALWNLHHLGIKKSLLIGGVGVSVGAWIKVYSVAPDRYLLALAGQSIGALFQVGVFSFPALLAAAWFGRKEVSLACAIGVFGDQFGGAIGFILPTFLVREGNKSTIADGLYRLNLFTAIACTVVTLCIILLFREKPPTTPSTARLHKLTNVPVDNVRKSIKALLDNKNFVLTMLAYGINVSVMNSICCLMNDMFRPHFPEYRNLVGVLGFLFIMAGIPGSLIGGYILDRMHLYKQLTMLIYGCSFFCTIAYAYTLQSGSFVTHSVNFLLLGFFSVSYYSIGVQMVVEITYPISESVATGLLSYFAQILGLILTPAYRYLFESWGDVSANLCMAFLLFIGFLLTCLTSSELPRQSVEKIGKQMGEKNVKDFISC